MLEDNDSLRAAFSADLLPMIPQLAEKTFDALEQLPMAGLFLYGKVVLPLELEKEEHKFLIALCQLWTVRYELIDVTHRRRSDYEHCDL